MLIVGYFKIFLMAVVSVPEIFKDLSIGIYLGIWTCKGYSLYEADVLYSPVNGF